MPDAASWPSMPHTPPQLLQGHRIQIALGVVCSNDPSTEAHPASPVVLHRSPACVPLLIFSPHPAPRTPGLLNP